MWLKGSIPTNGEESTQWTAENILREIKDWLNCIHGSRISLQVCYMYIISILLVLQIC